jgi:hypothetical protein
MVNPGAGTRHEFIAYRRRGVDGPAVTMKRTLALPGA